MVSKTPWKIHDIVIGDTSGNNNHTDNFGTIYLDLQEGKMSHDPERSRMGAALQNRTEIGCSSGTCLDQLG